MRWSDAINNSVGYYLWTKFWIECLQIVGGTVLLVSSLFLGACVFLRWVYSPTPSEKQG